METEGTKSGDRSDPSLNTLVSAARGGGSVFCMSEAFPLRDELEAHTSVDCVRDLEGQVTQLLRAVEVLQMK